VAPATGLTTGGTPVTLRGTGFRAGITVLFATTAATSVTVVSPTELSVVAPVAATPGVVSLTVRNTDNQTATLPAAFTYTLPAPSIASVVPNSGFTSGGTTITINGANFFIGATVSVGGVAATNVVRVSATRLTANTPPGAAGAANVVVTNTDTQSVTLTGGFTYVAPPTLSAISPTNGPVQGGTRITLTGTNLVQGATVTIGGVPAFAVNVVNSTTATAVTNSNTAGVRDVRLINPDTQGVTLTQAYTFDPAPELTAAAPRTGTTAGGTSVTLTGTGFLPGCTVLFGQDAATQVTINSPTELTAVSPARAEGVVTLTARNPDGQFAVLPRAFRFVAPPTLTALTPTSGDIAGGTLVRLTGTNFAPGAAVSFGGVPSTEVTYVSATELTALAPPHPRGAVDVVVDSSGAAVTLAAAFTYTRAAPSLVQLAPTSGAIEGGTTLTLTGSGFADGASIIIGGNAATNVVVVSPLLARATVPAHAPGAVDVVFTNDDGQTATLVAGFTFVAPPDGTTGTLTDGYARIVSIEAMEGFPENTVLQLAASLAQASQHVISRALVDEIRRNGNALTLPEQVVETHGDGVSGRVDQRSVVIGRPAFVSSAVVKRDAFPSAKLARLAPGHVVLAVAVDGRFAGRIVFADHIRTEAAATLAALRKSGIERIILLTGDQQSVAEHVGRSLGFDEIIAEASPAQKLAIVRREADLGQTMMVGDGINDAPALAAAHLGVALGARGAAAASEAADIVLLVDRLDRLAEAISIARRARRIAIQSVFFGIGLSTLGMVAAALGYLTPVAGALIQEAIDVAVILNALRALSGHGDDMAQGTGAQPDPAPVT
jgi:phosphoserine phosphatase